MPANMGFPMPPPADPQKQDFMAKLMAALGGSQGLMNLGGNLLAASGPSPQRTSLGQALGGGLLANQQFQQAQKDQQLKQMLMQSQILKNTKPTSENQPNSVREYEFAKSNGFNGSFQDWITAGGQSSRPSSVQEWEFYAALPPDKQAAYLEMKRNPNVFFGKVNEVPTIAKAPTAGMPAVTTPLSTTASEAAAAGQVKQAESQGGAVGTALGNIQGGIQTKGANAVTTQGTLDIAEPLIDVATGSAAGAARDKLAAFFGSAPDGAKAIAALKVLQANLMTSMPRMEGPQSDRDVQLYREAAGQIGDPTVPADIKKAAVATIRDIQNRYVQRATGSAPAGEVRRRKFNPATGKIE